MNERGIFMTGFPGFIARRLLRELLEGDGAANRYFFLVERRFLDTARRQCQRVEESFPGFAGRWHLMEGDLRKEGLGMTDEAHAVLRDSVTHVWHLAAVYDLAVPLSLAYSVNVEGTLQVLDLLEKWPHLERLHYISTCYVAGDRTGRIYEDELDCGQGFQNHYESTKHWAERLVQARRRRIPTVIFRPAIVVGDSRTGETIKGDGPYFVIQMLLKLPRFLPMVRLGASDAPTNVVPVDWLVRAMVALGGHPEAVGKVFQLADPNPLTAGELLESLIEILHRAPTIATVPAGLASRALAIPAVHDVLGMPKELVDYFNHKQMFDVTNTASLLAGHVEPCPSFDSYLPALVEFSRGQKASRSGRAA